jgi:hypothetical protein
MACNFKHDKREMGVRKKEPTFMQWQYEKTMRPVNDRPGLGYAYALSPDLHSTSQFVVAAPEIDFTQPTSESSVSLDSGWRPSPDARTNRFLQMTRVADAPAWRHHPKARKRAESASLRNRRCGADS